MLEELVREIVLGKIKNIQKKKKTPPEETWQSIEDQGEQEPHLGGINAERGHDLEP